MLQLALRDHLAVEQMDLPVRMRGEARIVCHHADRCAFAVQVRKQSHHGFAVLGIKIAGRLVGQKYAGRACQRTRHGDALLLTAAQLRGVVAEPVRHVHALQGVHHALLAVRGAHAGTVGEG